MTAEWYKAHGYEVSLQTDQATIDRAERDVTAAYITPIAGANTGTDEAIEALASLAFLLLLQRSIFSTRAGAKIKTTQTSTNADAWAILQEAAQTCHLALVKLRAADGSNADAKVTDICKIYFSTNFINS